MKDPQRSLPRAIIGALFIVSGLYMLVAPAGLPPSRPSTSRPRKRTSAGLSLILKDVTGNDDLEHHPGRRRGHLDLLRHPRHPLRPDPDPVRDRPRRADPTQVPPGQPADDVAGFNTVLVAIVVALIGGFIPSDYLWDTVSIGTLIAFSVVAIGIIVLAAPTPTSSDPSSIPGYPVTPILTVARLRLIMLGLPVITWAIFFLWLALVRLVLRLRTRHATLNTYADPEEIAESRGDEDK